ncbi:hypothetical protein [Sphingomonas sp. Leaf37]|uniref:hypothetical protein n=1 Tax=Sphingomonas sp. Leaf37 TaxID=2876552 RepID=UPI001E3AEEE4|nr:hypothetical protein [Sphingomonas sp. Leaf37]
MNIDTSNWGPFDPQDVHDAMCERERLAFTEYLVKRLKKMPRTGSDQPAIMVGAIMAIVQLSYAIHGNEPTDAVREGLHKTLDFAWLQCALMIIDKGQAN